MPGLTERWPCACSVSHRFAARGAKMISRPSYYRGESSHGCYRESDAALEIIRRPAGTRSSRWERFGKEPPLRMRSHGGVPRRARLRRRNPAMRTVYVRGVANDGTRGGGAIVRRISHATAAVCSSASAGGRSPLSQMTNLINCPCGHALERHDSAGCTGEYRRGSCDCHLTPAEALDSAVNAVRRKGPRRERHDAAAHIMPDGRP
jgi:hypothetical protein